MKNLSILLLIFLTSTLFAAESKITYFKCDYKEKRNSKAQIYFAIEDLKLYESKSSLVKYPGTDEEDDYEVIKVTSGKKDKYSLLGYNLNSQGGDLRISHREGEIRLFGDGDGYQLTDLVIWVDEDVEEKEVKVQGYLRDYGPVYHGEKVSSKQQFITCQSSYKPL